MRRNHPFRGHNARQELWRAGYRVAPLRPSYKKVANLEEKVRARILEIKQEIENGSLRSNYVTRESVAKVFQVNPQELRVIFMKLNREGLMSQAIPVAKRPDVYHINATLPTRPEPEYEPMFNFDKCPLCNRQLEVKERYGHKERSCYNGCFHQDLATVNRSEMVKVFNDEFYHWWSDGKGIKDNLRERINRKLAYWRKNERYFAELLTRF